MIATNGVRYATEYECEVLDVFTAIRHKTDLDHAGHLLQLNSRRYLRTADEMVELFRDVPGAVERTWEVSQPRNYPKKFYDLVVQVAIIRPGPIVGKMMHPYMRRRQGKEEVSYPHPSLEPVLKRTLGCRCFRSSC